MECAGRKLDTLSNCVSTACFNLLFCKIEYVVKTVEPATTGAARAGKFEENNIGKYYPGEADSIRRLR
jgi:hypothetical protein